VTGAGTLGTAPEAAPAEGGVERVDVLVVGGGPAGCLAARELARTGVSVILVDRSARPRWKVCGACVGPEALLVLGEAGLGDVCCEGPVVPVTSVWLEAPGRSVRLRAKEGARVAWSRAAMDEALWREAARAGATCLSECVARIGWIRGGRRRVVLRGPDTLRVVDARVVLDAAGLTGAPTPSRPERGPSAWAPRRRAEPGHARIGLGALFDGFRLGPVQQGGPAALAGSGVDRGGAEGCDAEGRDRGDDEPLPPGRVRMVIGREGYVGMVRLGDGTVDVAAAIAPGSVRALGAEGAVCALLGEVGLALEGTRLEGWRGTPTLDRRPERVAEPRVLRIGDALGYVEPFTGEGIGWALRSALDVVPLALRGVGCWDSALERAWTRYAAARADRDRRACRAVAWGLRRPRVVHAALGALGRWPGLASPFGLH